MPDQNQTTKPVSKYVTFYLSEDVIARQSLLILNPVTGKARHGMKSYIVTALLDKLFEAYAKGEKTIDINDIITKITNV